MNDADVEAAFASGRIDAGFRRRLLDFLDLAKTIRDPDSAVLDVVRRIQVVQAPAFEVSLRAAGSDGSHTRFAIENIPGAEHRPGLVAVFKAVHAGAMRNTIDPPELEKVDTFEQIHAILRTETQTALARSIREIWQPMQACLHRDVIVIPRGRRELRAPAAVPTEGEHGELAALPMSPEFNRLFDATTVDQSFCLLKRAIERMGRHFTDLWLSSEPGQSVAVGAASELLRSMRNVDLGKVICNGFASGVSDVLNPLHVLIQDRLERCRLGTLDAEQLIQITEQHVDFSVILAMFNLQSLAVLEDLLRCPARPETVAFLRGWTAVHRDFGGKGFALDCTYARHRFSVRDIGEGEGAGIAVVDLNRDAFTESEIQSIASRSIRLGCPSLGHVHREFTRTMCRAYFQVVLPLMIARQ